MSDRTPARGPGRGPAITPARLAVFFHHLGETGAVTVAAERAGLRRSTLYQLRRGNPAVARRWAEALDLGIDRLQDHAVDRATVGLEKPVWHRGEQVGAVHQPDNRLLQFLLKAHRPEAYDRAKAGSAALPFDLIKRMADAEKRMAVFDKPSKKKASIKESSAAVADDDRMKVEVARLRRLEGYRRDPLSFVRWAFPWEEEGGPLAAHKGPEKWQADVLRQIGEGLRAEKGPVRIAVASGHGVGKSALVAWLILWALATQTSTRGVVTANTETQLKTKTWAELGKWHRLALSHEWCALGATALVSAVPETEQGGRIDMVPWAAHNAEAFAGLHNKGSRVLLVFDEASAIADPIWETAEGALTDAGTEIVWVVFGNPTRTAGRFFECFNRFRKRWRTQQVDSAQVSLTDKRQLARWVADYGEDSDFVRVRIRGKFPRAGSMQFIDSERVEAAMARTPDPNADRHQPLVMGVDVARFGDDRSVIFLRKGRDAKIDRVEKHQGLDLMTLAGRVAERAAAERVAAVFVDEGGIGAGVVDRLRQLGVPRVFGINFGGASAPWDDAGARPRYANKRAEIWGSVKDWLAQGCLPDDPELAADLTGVEYGYNAKGEIQLEKKDDMKKRGLASPDIADALALTFALPASANWDLPPVQEYCITEYDLYRDFDEDYWDEKDEYDG